MNHKRSHNSAWDGPGVVSLGSTKRVVWVLVDVTGGLLRCRPQGVKLATDKEFLGWQSTSGDFFGRVHNISRKHRVDGQAFQDIHQHVEPDAKVEGAAELPVSDSQTVSAQTSPDHSLERRTEAPLPEEPLPDVTTWAQRIDARRRRSVLQHFG